jgi:nicotinamidase-related amidase
MSISEIADALERTQRQGAEKDQPEGSRYAVFSDTALNAMARELRLASADRPDAETFDGRESR